VESSANDIIEPQSFVQIAVLHFGVHIVTPHRNRRLGKRPLTKPHCISMYALSQSPAEITICRKTGRYVLIVQSARYLCNGKTKEE